MENDSGYDFRYFMVLVDNKLRLLCGLSHECLEDYDYYTAWIDCDDPDDVAEAVLENAGF